MDLKRYMTYKSSVFSIKSSVSITLGFKIHNIWQIQDIENRSFIRKHKFYDGEEKELVVEKITRLNGSTFGNVYRIESRNQRLFLKIKRHIFPFHNWDMLLEHLLYRKLSLDGFAVPISIAIDLSHTRINADYSIDSFIEGDNFLFAFKKHGPRIIENLGKSLAYLHKNKGKKFGYLDAQILIDTGQFIGSCNSWWNFISSNYQNDLVALTTNSLLSQSNLEFMNAAFLKFKELKIEENTLLHGDLFYKNIIASQYKIYFVDFEDALIGDPIFDIALFFSFFEEYGYLPNFFEGYSGSDVVEDNEARRFWFYVLRISVSDLARSVRWKDWGKSNKERIMRNISRSIKELRKYSF
ncbi:MAG: aminoglycoside phosphotransferase family protein [Candidatus Thermoplasmatota archaeon]|nr:aminoglycoside phosphotransferase family protein [Candidatus Thermoplasmatota archaeon]